MAQRRKMIARPAYADPRSTIMASLVPVHTAATQEWLVDAAATAAERALNAPYTFVFFEDQHGKLAYQRPASDLRRRSVQRAIDALGGDAFKKRLDPKISPALTEALDSGVPAALPFEDVLGPIAGEERAAQAIAKLGTARACIAPLETAGERLGAIIVLVQEEVDVDHVHLLAEHIAVAAVNLRNAQTAREQGVIDIVRSVFDARKLESELQRELTRAQRYKREVSIIVIEATNLRLLRERFGTFLTDRLLQRLGESLAQHSRDIDVIGAYKESGYTMILSEATSDGAEQAAARLLAAATGVQLEGDAVPGLELHLVAGWATSPADGDSSDAVFAAAERRMYGSAWQVA
jgi:diguanylate cyclase (GGDEF)-like protein